VNPDFRLLDPDGDPDRHQNLITWSLGHALPLQEISSKSVYNFFSYPMDRQTDQSENITSFFGRGKDLVLLAVYCYSSPTLMSEKALFIATYF